MRWIASGREFVSADVPNCALGADHTAEFAAQALAWSGSDGKENGMSCINLLQVPDR